MLLDPRGAGVSSPATTGRGYTIEDYVADLDAVRADLGVERCDVLGHSYGGIVAASYAASHPDRVDHLVLANTLARFGPLHEAVLQAAFERHRSSPWFPAAERAFHRLRGGAQRISRRGYCLPLRRLSRNGPESGLGRQLCADAPCQRVLLLAPRVIRMTMRWRRR